MEYALGIAIIMCAAEVILGFMLLFGRIGEIYGELAAKNFMLPEPKYRPLDALIEYEQKKQQKYQQAGEYWLEKLEHWPAPVSFNPLGKTISRKNIRHSSFLDEQQWQQCLTWSLEAKISSADVLFALIFLALYRETDQTKLSIGMIAMQRFGNPSINIPCLQINTVPLLVDMDEADNFADLAKAVSVFKRKCRKHCDYRTEDLKRESLKTYQREPYGPLVNILPFHHAENFGQLKATTHNLASGAVEDIMFQVYVSEGSTPRIDLDANPNSYAMSRLKTIAQTLNELLTFIANKPFDSLR